MSESAVRRLFIAVLVGLVVQHGVVAIVGLYVSEPWPTIVLPAFKDVHGRSGVVESKDQHIDVVLADGQRVSFERPQFMTFMPIIHQSVFLENQCQPASLSGAVHTDVCRNPEGKSLFLNRARGLFPEKDVRSVDIIWKRIRVDMQTRESETTPLDTLRLRP